MAATVHHRTARGLPAPRPGPLPARQPARQPAMGSARLLARLCRGLAAAGLLAPGLALALAGGEPVSTREFQHQYPWVVLIENDTGTARCTGVLVAPRHVLTAGHCVGAPDPAGGRPARSVHFGSPLKDGTRRVAVAAERRHPGYRMQPEEVAFDLGLLRLVRPVRLPQAILPSPAEGWALLRSSEPAVLLGWGRTGPGAPHPRQLHRLGVDLLGLRLTPSHITYWSDRGGPCGGDSGGPLVMAASDGTPLLLGIASVTDGNLCDRGGGSAAYTNVVELMEFLQAEVPGLVIRPPPVDFPAPRP